LFVSIFVCPFLLVNYSSFFVVEVSDLLLLEGCCWTRHLLCLLVRQWQVPKVILLDSNVGGVLVLLQVLMQQQMKQRHAQQQLQQQQQQQQQVLKVGSPQLVSSPQIMQAPSPQQQLSPQPDQSFAALPVVTKVGVPIHHHTLHNLSMCSRSDYLFPYSSQNCHHGVNMVLSVCHTDS
jgi:hypothetical protein